MKYKQVYNLLQERQRTMVGFRYTDRSGWRSPVQDYMTRYRPLWIIAEDPACSRRIWITQEGYDMQVTVADMDAQGKNHNSSLRVACRTIRELTAGLQRLFEEKGKVVA